MSLVNALTKPLVKKSLLRGGTTAEEEWENHVIVRFPTDIASSVDEIISADDQGSRLAINFEPDMRNGTFRVDQHILPFKVYDLPCITEVMKTIDKKTLYKVVDVSQMILCSTTLHKDVVRLRNQSGGSNSGDGSDKKENFLWPHGLTPAMKNARKCRFRKTKKKKYMDAPDVERELKRLLRSDLDAHSIRWEVVPIEQKDVLHLTVSMDNESAQNEQTDELSEEKVALLLDSLSDSGNEASSSFE